MTHYLFVTTIKALKYVASFIANILCFFWGKYYATRVKLLGFWPTSVLVGTLTGPLARRIRYAFYRQTLLHLGDNVDFLFGCNFSYPDISIGNNVRIGLGANIGLVDIGNDTLMGANCNLLSGARMHGIERTDIPIRMQSGSLTRISIGKDCWIGANVVVMANLGDGCVLGSGSVITKPIPPYSIAVGNPAKVIRDRRSQSYENTKNNN